MAPIQGIMADVMRMRKFIKLITSVRGKILTKFTGMFMEQYLKGNNMALIKNYNSGYYVHAQTSNAYNFFFELKFN